LAGRVPLPPLLRSPKTAWQPPTKGVRLKVGEIVGVAVGLKAGEFVGVAVAVTAGLRLGVAVGGTKLQ
jgi:hypothetical protein